MKTIKVEKELKDMSVSELTAHMKKLGKPRSFRKNIWAATKTTSYPDGYLEADRILKQKIAEEDAEHKLRMDKIYTEMSRNRAERASKDLHSRAIEPNPYGSSMDPIK